MNLTAYSAMGGSESSSQVRASLYKFLKLVFISPSVNVLNLFSTLYGVPASSQLAVHSMIDYFYGSLFIIIDAEI